MVARRICKGSDFLPVLQFLLVNVAVYLSIFSIFAVQTGEGRHVNAPCDLCPELENM
jgi:hypothetical protein